jgi:hypothetical protein
MILSDDQGGVVRLDESTVGRGGEGGIFPVADRTDLVAKVYHQLSPGREAKVAAMLRNPPREPSPQHVSICWPQRLLYQPGASRRFAGFLMPRVDLASHVELLKLYNQLDREQVAPAFNWRYLLSTAANIASVVGAIHERGYVIGDLNEGNFFVSSGTLAVLVDCDSMQVPNPAGGFFRCPVGKSELAPPELNGHFGEIDLTPGQDRFTLGILLFRVLMESTHPFAGLWQGPGDDPPLERRIANGDCPYTGSRHVLPAPIAPPFDLLPAAVQGLFVRCFGEGLSKPDSRPTAHEWRDALREVERNLSTCTVNRHHVYPQHRPTCPWCERARLFGGRDPFPDLAVQQALPPVAFLSPQPRPSASPPPAAAGPAAARASRAWPSGRPAPPAWNPLPSSTALPSGLSATRPATRGAVVKPRHTRRLLWLTGIAVAALAGSLFWLQSPAPLTVHFTRPAVRSYASSSQHRRRTQRSPETGQMAPEGGPVGLPAPMEDARPFDSSTPAEPPAPLPAPGEQGTLVYRGTYVCGQGLTAMTLRIDGIGEEMQSGVMIFEPTLQSRFQFPPGAYTVQGIVDPLHGRLILTPVRWLRQPPGFIFLPMRGFSEDEGETFTGSILGGGCGAFHISRVLR